VFVLFVMGVFVWGGGPKIDNAIVDTPQKSMEIKYINIVLLKKLKIALSMTTDDILDVFAEAEIYPSKLEIVAYLRKEGHLNLKPSG
ncbi:DUF1456 family protein, partial [Enterococcus faecium]|uniref:DUF1456 family protein n=1 Tax=Enterococcus faecium TaxID=1352 RepID=UPI003CC56D52